MRNEEELPPSSPKKVKATVQNPYNKRKKTNPNPWNKDNHRRVAPSEEYRPNTINSDISIAQAENTSHRQSPEIARTKMKSEYWDDNVGSDRVRERTGIKELGAHQNQSDVKYDLGAVITSPTHSIETDDYSNFEEVNIKEDIFSIFFVSPVLSLGFWYALLIFCIQILILSLALSDLLKDGTANNPFGIPRYTPPVVKYAAMIAIIATVLQSNEVLSFFDDVSLEYSEDILDTFPAATSFKWHLSNLLRFAIGLLGVFVAFVFISRADDVLGMFLDFAALQFVSELDNIGFFIVDRGYFLMKLKNVTTEIKEITFLTRNMFQVVPISTNTLHRVSFICLWLVMFGSWLPLLYDKQPRGVYFQDDCTEFEVKFKDLSYNFFQYTCEVLEQEYEEADEKEKDEKDKRRCPDTWKDRLDEIDYSSFNGVYSIFKNKRGGIALKGDRPIYYQKQRDDTAFDIYGDTSPSGKFEYCETLGAWVFSIPGVSKAVGADDCSWLMRSRKTTALSLDDVDETDWKVWTGIKSETSVDITCVECLDRKGGVGSNGNDSCSFHGSCVSKDEDEQTKVCLCTGNETIWMGPECSACVACTALSIDSSPWVTSNETAMIRLNNTDGRPFDIYSHPVYYHGHIADGSISKPSILALYSGSKYWIVSLDDLNIDVSTQKQLIEQLESFHSAWDVSNVFKPLHVSESTNSPMPIGVRWKSYETQGDAGFEFKCLYNEQLDTCKTQGSIFPEFEAGNEF